MNYDRYAQDPVNSPMFNGNATSMGGQGAPVNYTGVMQPFRAPYNRIAPGGGGGCVTEGPFKDMVVSIGPGGTVVPGIPKNPRMDGLGANPRCLRRDVNRNSALGATANYTYSLITEYKDIDGFYNRYLGQPQLKGDLHPWGLHNGGHYIIGGDPGGVGSSLLPEVFPPMCRDLTTDALQDFYCSPGDPAFYFHHGMLDRVWWIWQMQDPENRISKIPGQSQKMPGMNHLADIRPPMSALELQEQKKRDLMKRQAKNPGDVIVDLGWTGGPVPIKDLNDNLGGIGGAMCYIYV
jgi:tyrosinase